MKIKFIKYIFFCFILFLVGCENDEEFQKIDKDNIIKQSQQANLSISKDDLGLFPFEKITVYCTHNTEKPVLEIKNTNPNKMPDI